jgi:hypothetical protein
LAEASSQLIVQALERSLTASDGLPLLVGKSGAGLFPTSAPGKEAAQHAQSAGLLRSVRTEGKGAKATAFFALTERGLTHLLEQSSPRPVLEALLQSMDTCQARIDTWIANVNDNRRYLDTLRGLAERVLNHLQKPETTLPPWARNGHTHHPQTKIVDLLREWQSAGKIGDYPLPDLFEQTRAAAPKLTLGQFHDALRSLHEQFAIYLHPWTGPLHELPQPATSLLVGHEIAYYASLRS